MSRSPTAVAMRRIQSELNEWLLHPPEGCKLIQYEPLLTWVIEMHGPDRDQSAAPLYHGELFPAWRLWVQLVFVTKLSLC